AALLAEVAPGRLGGEAGAHIVGVTGPPGAGKSTLLGALTRAWRADGRTVAVLAVDPSSKRSGGALLGDRARIEADPADRGLFVRSTSAGERLGGLAPATRAAAQALSAAFDVVVIETVGGGHGRGRGPARLRRRAAVPEGRDHGGARRARGHEGRPRRRRAARPARPPRRAPLARRERGAGRPGVL